MKKNHQPEFLCLSDSDAPIIEQSQKCSPPLLNISDSPTKRHTIFLERHLKSNFLMKVVSCEEFDNISNTAELDKKMKRRKKNVFFIIFTIFLN